WHMAHSGRKTAVVERRYIGGFFPQIKYIPPKKKNLWAEGGPLARQGAGGGALNGAPPGGIAQGWPAQTDTVGAPECRAFGALQSKRSRTDLGRWTFCGTEDARSAPE